MKKVSHWARKHPALARIYIIVGLILITTIAVVTGHNLSLLGVRLNFNAVYFSILLYVMAWLAYPRKNGSQNAAKSSYYYFRQKSCDFMLAATTFCMLVLISNRSGKVWFGIESRAAFSMKPGPGADSTKHQFKTIKAFSAAVKNSDGSLLKWKERKQLLKEQIRAIKKADDMSKGAKVALIILSVIVALGLLVAVAALACNISCSGGEGAAIVIFVLGAAAIIFLLTVAIRSISGKRRKRKQLIEEEERKGQ